MGGARARVPSPCVRPCHQCVRIKYVVKIYQSPAKGRRVEAGGRISCRKPEGEGRRPNVVPRRRRRHGVTTPPQAAGRGRLTSLVHRLKRRFTGYYFLFDDIKREDGSSKQVNGSQLSWIVWKHKSIVGLRLSEGTLVKYVLCPRDDSLLSSDGHIIWLRNLINEWTIIVSFRSTHEHCIKSKPCEIHQLYSRLPFGYCQNTLPQKALYKFAETQF